ncbi:MAG: hypothetical protein ABI766_09245 [Gemmatimonadales bacterium]
MLPPINNKLGVQFEQLIVAGGDDRLDLLASGLNRYHVRPTEFEGVFNRASCTCSPFSPDGYEAATELYTRLDHDVFEGVLAEHTRTLKELINYDGQDRFHVFYAPSGSDLCYYPLLFFRLIHRERKIFNVITCPEELGSGSNLASSGRYYFTHNQMGQRVNFEGLIGKQGEIESASFAARSHDGKIIDHWQEILTTIHDKYRSHAVNANLVIGSKSGIENNVTIVSQAPEDVLWTVDLCQFRASRLLINGLIGMNCLVMLTGSKFYQGPPFCAVLLVPKSITQGFRVPDRDLVAPFANVFSRYDIPEQFSELRRHLPDFRNYGLLLRWHAALHEMKAMSKLDGHEVGDAIRQWNEFVIGRLGASQQFQLMPDQHITNKTIVSFRVKKNDGSFFSHVELSRLYDSICQRDDLAIGDCRRALIGQPVKYGDKSFIRIALGASDVRQFIQDGTDFTKDGRLVEIVEEIARERQWN